MAKRQVGLLIAASTVLLLAPLAAQAGSDVISLRTQDGFELIFDTYAGRFSRLEVPGYGTDLSGTPDLGVYLYDPAGATLLDASALPVESEQMRGGGLRLTRESASEEIRTEEVWTAHERHVELEVTVTHLGEPPVSRAVEACVQLPLDLTGKQWHHHLDQSETIQTRPEPYNTLLTRLVDIGTFGDGSHSMKSELEFNLHGINLIGDDSFGLAMAIHPEKPSAYYVAYGPVRNSYDACLHLGIYEDHMENEDSVAFGLAFFSPDDPEWGLRSALEKYVSVYPEAFAGTLSSPSGMVVTKDYTYSEYPDPEEFHVEAMWSGYKAQNADAGVYSLAYLWPTGYWDRSMRHTTVSASAGSDTSWEADIAACLDIYQDCDRGQHPFEEICTGWHPFTECDQVTPTGGTYGPIYDWESGSFCNIQAFQATVGNRLNFLFNNFVIYEPLKGSLLQDEAGDHASAMSYASALFSAGWDPDYKRCYFNGISPDPGLAVSLSDQYSANPAPTQTLSFGHLNLEVAKRANGLYGDAYLHEDPVEGTYLYHGAAVDTVGLYLRQDFNPDRLRTATLPLSYDDDSGRVVALEHLGLLAFVRALRASLPTDAPLSMNGYPISGLLGQDIDFFVNEMSRRKRDGDWIDELYDEDLPIRLRRTDRIRMSVYQRPVTLYAVFDRAGTEQELIEQMEEHLPFYTSRGIYINPVRYGYQGETYFWLERPQDQGVIQEYKRHVDAVHALTIAGWEPVPFAEALDLEGSAIADILVERFGHRFFTLYNGDDEALDFSVSIDWKGTGSPPASVRDWETGEVLSFAVTGDECMISELGLEAHAVQILEVESLAVYLPLVCR